MATLGKKEKDQIRILGTALALIPIISILALKVYKAQTDFGIRVVKQKVKNPFRP